MLLALVVLATQAYAEVDKSIYSPNGHYRIPLKQEEIEGFEHKSYLDLLRMVDEINRKNGKETGYVSKAHSKLSRLHDEVDLVPVVQFVGDNGTSSMQEELTPKIDNLTTLGYTPTYKLVEEKEKAFREEDVSYSRQGNQKRVYFGNRNIIKDLIITKQFDEERETRKDNQRYFIDGSYEMITGKPDGLTELTVAKYKEHMEGKTKEEQANYLASLETVKKAGIKAEKGELYTEVDGKRYKVLWDVEPVSVERVKQYSWDPDFSANEKFEDKIYTHIYKYQPFESKDEDGKDIDSKGRMLYTKDGSIIVEDKLDYKENIKFSAGWSGEKNLDEITKEDSGSSSDVGKIGKYLKEKEQGEEKVKEWKEAFENGEFDKKIKQYREEAEKLNEEIAVLQEEYEKLDKAYNDVLKDPNCPKDHYNYYNTTSESCIKYFESKTPQEQAILKKKLELKNQKSEKNKEKDKKTEEKGNKKEEFEKKYNGKIIENKKIYLEKKGKDIEFRGRGRIEGTVDLGEGDNHLTIAEAFTGRYGTNIILGAEAKLKGIKLLKVGGSGNSTNTISGRTSLSLDLDPTKRNAEGHLFQHALAESDDKIVFINATANSQDPSDTELKKGPMWSRNNFELELMVSRLSTNETVNIGRKTNYQYKDKKGRTWDMKIPFISDSIAHNVIDRGEITKDESGKEKSLLKVEVKDSIKRLSEEENDVYQSIKNAATLGLLHPTLTTTNKKTKFSVKDEEDEMNKQRQIFSYLKTKDADKLIQDISQFHLDDKKKEEIKKNFEELQKDEEIKKSREKSEKYKKLHETKEYKEANLTSFVSRIQAFLNKAADNWNAFEEEGRKEKAADEAKLILEEAQKMIKEIKKENLEILKKEYGEYKIQSMITEIEAITKLDSSKTLSQKEIQTLYENLRGLKDNIEKNENYEKVLLNELIDTFKDDSKPVNQKYKELKRMIFYTMREEEALSELKEVISQMKDSNIYSKVNKIAKNEISTYTNIPFDMNRSLSTKSHYSRGGFISSRIVQDNFKGNTYTAYGLYEKQLKTDTQLGFIFGGANTDYTLTHNKRTARTIPANSTVKGVSAYAGAYFGKKLYHELNWINGLGIQVGNYTVNRHLKNNYQTLDSKGKAKIGALNAYTGMVLDYPLQEDVVVQVKGVLAYTYLHQGNTKESDALALDICSKNYHYVDGELGISLNKTLYAGDHKSNMSAGISAISAISGYKNDDLQAKVHGSSSSFRIKGDRVKKDAVKLLLDYNVQMDAGFNYGLEGTYISNQDESNVKIGIKAGYSF